MTEEQRRWWEEGCYCLPGKCVCGTDEDPFVIEKQDLETPLGKGD